MKCLDELLSRFFEQTADCIVAFDPQLRLIALNPASQQTLQTILGKEAQVGQTLDELFADFPEQKEVLVTQWSQALAGEEFTVTAQFGDPRLTRRWYELHYRPLRNEQGDISGAFQIAQDVTAQCNYELATQQHLEAINQELLHSNRDLEQFAYVASHDLKEPLRTVVSYTQRLEQRYGDRLDQRGQRYLGHIVNAGTRMQQLVTELLNYARLHSTQERLTTVDCDQILDIVLSNFKHRITTSQATITCSHLPTITANPVVINQLFQNLISNALKFSVEPPQVEVGVRSQGEFWCFWVQDQGIGIEPEYHERIFQIFQQLHLQEEYPGTGIGLALCKKIVESYGGEIWVESELGGGATFYFTLPKSCPG